MKWNCLFLFPDEYCVWLDVLCTSMYGHIFLVALYTRTSRSTYNRSLVKKSVCVHSCEVVDSSVGIKDLGRRKKNLKKLLRNCFLFFSLFPGSFELSSFCWQCFRRAFFPFPFQLGIIIFFSFLFLSLPPFSRSMITFYIFFFSFSFFFWPVATYKQEAARDIGASERGTNSSRWRKEQRKKKNIQAALFVCWAKKAGSVSKSRLSRNRSPKKRRWSSSAAGYQQKMITW